MLYDIKRFDKRNSLNEGFWDDFTNRDVMTDYPVSHKNSGPSVNILRQEDEYLIELAAPGLCRENYTLEVRDDVMNIHAEYPAGRGNDARYQRREYYADDFDRSFVLPKNVKQEAIAASCSDGILTIHLPVDKKENQEKRRSIEIN